jgi:hypothetical protein
MQLLVDFLMLISNSYYYNYVHYVFLLYVQLYLALDIVESSVCSNKQNNHSTIQNYYQFQHYPRQIVTPTIVSITRKGMTLNTTTIGAIDNVSPVWATINSCVTGSVYSDGNVQFM